MAAATILFSAGAAATMASDDDGYSGQDGANGQNGQNGLPGQNGVNGQNGLGGQNGLDGLAGIPGATGADGMPGADGLTGAQGLGGADGFAGSGGLTGFNGASGTDGEPGLDGAAGANGADGFAGANGMSGPDGALGLSGLDGAPGASGNSGTVGLSGLDGAAGADGLAGQNGSQGANGAAGSDGALGLAGLNGQDGAGGQDGASGQDGANGQNGAAGANGTSGRNGVDGRDGRDGRNGVPTRIPVATAHAPALIASEDTCMGSTALGGQGITVGVSVATTWQDDNCRRLKNARQLDSLGYRRAAVALLCVDDEVRTAMRVAGTPCPGEPQPIVEIATPPLALPQPEPQRFSVHFDFDSSALKPADEPALQQMLSALREDASLAVDIEGHADSVGPDAYNVALSQRRARAVVGWLAAHGAAPAQLDIEAKGESEPTASNATAAGRALNRRVEVVLRPRLVARS